MRSAVKSAGIDKFENNNGKARSTSVECEQTDDQGLKARYALPVFFVFFFA